VPGFEADAGAPRTGLEVTWRTDLTVSSSNERLGTVFVSWRQLALANGRYEIADLRWRSEALVPTLAVEVQGNRMSLEPPGERPQDLLDIRVKVTGSRPGGAGPPRPDDAFAFPFDIIRRSFVAGAVAPRVTKEHNFTSDLATFEVPDGDGDNIVVTNTNESLTSTRLGALE
jgi:hypothetical protein